MGMFKNLFVQSDRSEIELFEVKDDANLLEIKLKDTDSVPEIYYKGQDLKERFLDGKVIYNQQKIFRWYLSNVKLVQDRNNSESAGSLSSFADVTGRTSDEFAKLFKSNPSQAIIEFVKGLGEAEKHGTSAISILSDMDIKEVRLRDSLLRAANASGVFEGAIKRGTQAWEENTALTDEANKRYETTESKVKALKNEVVDIAIDMGGPFVDALRDALKASKPLLETLSKAAKAFSNTSPEVQKSIVKLIAWTTAAGPVLKIAGSGASKISTFGQAFVDLNAKLNKRSAMKAAEKGLNFLSTVSINGSASLGNLAKNLGETAGKATVLGSATSSAAGSSGIGAMTAALGGLNPILLGIVGVGGTLALGYAAWKTFGEEAWNSSQRVKQWGVDVGREVDGTLDGVQDKLTGANGKFELLKQGFTEADATSMADNFEKAGKSLETSLTNRISAIDKSLKTLLSERNSWERFLSVILSAHRM